MMACVVFFIFIYEWFRCSCDNFRRSYCFRWMKKTSICSFNRQFYRFVDTILKIIAQAYTNVINQSMVDFTAWCRVFGCRSEFLLVCSCRFGVFLPSFNLSLLSLICADFVSRGSLVLLEFTLIRLLGFIDIFLENNFSRFALILSRLAGVELFWLYISSLKFDNEIGTVALWLYPPLGRE